MVQLISTMALVVLMLLKWLPFCPAKLKPIGSSLSAGTIQSNNGHPNSQLNVLMLICAQEPNVQEEPFTVLTAKKRPLIQKSKMTVVKVFSLQPHPILKLAV